MRNERLIATLAQTVHVQNHVHGNDGLDFRDCGKAICRLAAEAVSLSTTHARPQP